MATLRRVTQLIRERCFNMAAAVALSVGKNRMEALGDVVETADLRLLTDCFLKAGLPAGAFNFLTSPGRTLGQELISHPDLAGVIFTGCGPREPTCAR